MTPQSPITVRVRVQVVGGLSPLRWRLDQLAIEYGLADRCDRCYGAIYADRDHTCPVVIDVEPTDPDLPAIGGEVGR